MYTAHTVVLCLRSASSPACFFSVAHPVASTLLCFEQKRVELGVCAKVRGWIRAG